MDVSLLRHVGEGLGQVLLAEGELANGPDLGVGLESLLQLSLKGASLEGDDLGGGVGIVGNGRTALGAEETVDNLARGALGSGVGLDWAIESELVLGDYSDQGVGRAALSLAVIAVIIASEKGLVDVNRVGDSLAKTVSAERHVEYFLVRLGEAGKTREVGAQTVGQRWVTLSNKQQ